MTPEERNNLQKLILEDEERMEEEMDFHRMEYLFTYGSPFNPDIPEAFQEERD